MGRSYSFKEKPRFSDEDCERACCLMADYNVTEEVSFGEIYERKSIATMVALEEGVAHKWFSGRAVILGDAAHKVHLKSDHLSSDGLISKSVDGTKRCHGRQSGYRICRLPFKPSRSRL